MHKGERKMISNNNCKSMYEYDYKGLSTDKKPMGCGVNSLFIELDTGDFYYFNGVSWEKFGVGVNPHNDFKSYVSLALNNVSGAMLNGVTKIRKYAFNNYGTLTGIVIPNTVTSIEEHAFAFCSALPRITIPQSVTSIGDDAFVMCYDLKEVIVLNPTPPTLGSNAFFGCSSDLVIYVPSRLVDTYKAASGWSEYADKIQAIQSDAEIDQYAGSEINQQSMTTFCLYINGNLTQITSEMLDDVVRIRQEAFVNSDLTSVTLPNSVNIIGSSAFRLSSSLNSITIPASVTAIGSAAFNFCTSLESITLPSSITWIGSSAFMSCSALASVTVQSVVPPEVGQKILDGASNNLVIYVPSGSVDAYKAAEGWSEYADKIQAIQSN